MSDAVMWIIPEAPAPQVAVAEGGRKVDSSGLRFGILDNSKSNADHLLQMIIDGVKASLPISSGVKLRKPSTAAGALPEVLDELAREADVVISAMAD